MRTLDGLSDADREALVDIPPETLRAMAKAFAVQRAQAKARSVGFLFTFVDWALWWWAHGWARRGNGADDLVMARKGDLGPYAPGNVYCATFRQNAKDVDPARIGEALRAKRRLPRHEWLEWRARRRAA